MNSTLDPSGAGLNAVLRTALDAVVVMRADGTVAGWNEVAERTFGWSFLEAVGKRMSELIIPNRHREAHESGLLTYLATGHGPALNQRFEIEALHRDGREFPIELSITPADQSGEPVFVGFLRDISERRDAARRQELLVGELNHRVKNLLGVVAGIAHQTARASTSLVDFAPAFNGRLAALARAHEVITSSTWKLAPLRELIDQLLGVYAIGPRAQVSLNGCDVHLPPRQLLSVSMILHELLTNAIKYGALATADGRITLEWRPDGDEIWLRWTETFIRDAEKPTRKGFGSKMIDLSVRHELDGRYTFDWRRDGMSFELHFPLGQECAA